MSTSTGPGLPLRAMWNALAMAAGISSARVTCTFHLVTGMEMPITSVS